MSEHAEYPNVYWSVENLSKDSKKIGPAVKLFECLWRVNVVLYHNINGSKIQVLLERDILSKYPIDSYFHSITSVCIDDGTRYFEQSKKIMTSLDKHCIWEGSDEQLLELNVDFQRCVNFFMSFQPGEDWKTFENQYGDGKKDPRVEYSLSVLRQDFEKLLTNGDYADVILTCEGEKFPVHKGILSARSEVFRNLFQREDKKPDRQELLSITDISANALRHVLRYIYMGEMPTDTSSLSREIYQAIQTYKAGCWT